MKLTHDLTASPKGIFSESATQETDLGAKIVTDDGSVYRYVKAGGTTLVIGTLLDGPATIATHTNMAVVLGTAGATAITVTLGAVAITANQYAGGYVVVNDEAGEGYSYRIKSHPAADALAALIITLEDDEKIQTALTTSSEVTLIANQYNGVVIHAQTEAGVPVGVATYPITTLYYGWIKTRGVTAVLNDNAPPEIGECAAASTTTDGCVTEGTGPLGVVGFALAQGVSTEKNPVFLTID